MAEHNLWATIRLLMGQQWHVQYASGGEQTTALAQLRPVNVFDDPRICVWRDLPERQNCYLDLPASAGMQTPLRLHVKRYKPPHGDEADVEADAIRLLEGAGIGTVPLVAWGTCEDGRGFLISRDLAGYVPADRAVREGLSFASVLPRVASLAAKLHNAGLHHRDLYLCHFFVDPLDQQSDMHLIDPGRVARLPRFPMNLRWIVKDLAQLCYSLREVDLTQHQQELLDTYFAQAKVPCPWLIRGLIPFKVASIARHDRKLQAKRPGRRVSIPGPR